MNPVGIWVRRDPGRPAREALLLECLGGYASAYGLPVPAAEDIIRPGPGRKPYLRGNPFLFSISHSGEYWACAVGAAPVGLDIQLRQPCNYRDIASRFFTTEEQDYLRPRGAEAFLTCGPQRKATSNGAARTCACCEAFLWCATARLSARTKARSCGFSAVFQATACVCAQPKRKALRFILHNEQIFGHNTAGYFNKGGTRHGRL